MNWILQKHNKSALSNEKLKWGCLVKAVWKETVSNEVFIWTFHSQHTLAAFVSITWSGDVAATSAVYDPQDCLSFPPATIHPSMTPLSCFVSPYQKLTGPNSFITYFYSFGLQKRLFHTLTVLPEKNYFILYFQQYPFETTKLEKTVEKSKNLVIIVYLSS